jgi:dihydroorotase
MSHGTAPGPDVGTDNGGPPLEVLLEGYADMHAHLRQDAIVPGLIAAHLSSHCDTILAMPNTSPPVSRVFARDETVSGWSVEGYRARLGEAGADGFRTLVIPLYLTPGTTPSMIEAGARSGLLTCAKYYPPHGTTGSAHGLPMDELLRGDVLRAMSDNGVRLLVHGETHGVEGERWFGRRSNAEESFYRGKMRLLTHKFPDLRVVCEHITTKVAADFVASEGPGVAATVTPMHLLYVIGDLVKGWLAHLKCMPIVKFEEDVEALRIQVTRPGQTKFFAGTDSAPHPQAAKHTDCNCASGCFTATVAPQLYAMAFEAAGIDLASEEGQASFRAFMCHNGPDFHGVPRPQGNLRLVRTPSRIVPYETAAGPIMPLPVGLVPDGPDRHAFLPWSIAS